MAAHNLLQDYLNADLSSSEDEDVADADGNAGNPDNNNAEDELNEYRVDSDESDEELEELDIVERPYQQDNILIPEQDMEMFGDIQSTMITIAGRLRHFKYHEAVLTKILEPEGDIICIKSNFGCKPPEFGVQKNANRKTTRGRKKKEKTKKPRAIQGSGLCFNSQTTFITKSMQDGKQYQFKIFRNGKIQLPGAKPALYADIYNKLDDIIKMLNRILKKPDDPQIELVRFAPSMKNYRFDLKKAKSQLIDLFGLSVILNDEWIDGCVIDWSENYDDQFIGRDEDMKITYLSVDYTRQDTRLSLQFATPLPGRPDKCARVNIFMKGVIKILGSLHDSVSVAIIRYLHQIMKDHPELLIDEEVDEIDTDNIPDSPITLNIYKRAQQLYFPSILNTITITDEDEREFSRWLDACDVSGLPHIIQTVAKAIREGQTDENSDC